ncbi:hypothetical protein STSP2_03127 [Anaerohalosphaera lusitana]|uniref:Uncharacterized protein n=1 Tax=Anaerohalosphaera lusitana TaxID=1936003 RepID=A0A1U9NQ67_9BACT|nr:hypothetical protein [Anaerohalosphaera lusitana]AQT69927.1 hypothetical protein STSP2_03127 [Anaerohalosphaera lusitana]
MIIGVAVTPEFYDTAIESRCVQMAVDDGSAAIEPCEQPADEPEQQHKQKQPAGRDDAVRDENKSEPAQTHGRPGDEPPFPSGED